MFIIDVQGFQYGQRNFICKEIAIINVDNGYLVGHKFITYPVELKHYNIKVQNRMCWSSKYLHGLEFDGSSGQNYLPCENISNFIKENVHEEIIAVKGIEKKNG